MTSDSSHPLILAMDTATLCSSVALTSGTRENGTILASLSLNTKVSHSRRLLSAIDWLMKTAGVDWQSVAGIGVSLGPGSFTGLRIGMATAKGLIADTGKMLFGVSTLDVLAGRCVWPGLICAVLDARKSEVYAAFYRCNAEGFTEQIGTTTVITPKELVKGIDGSVFMVGNGGTVYKDLFYELLGDRVKFAPSPLNEPSASVLGMIAGEMLTKGKQLDVAEAVPIYIRNMELNLLKDV